MYRESEEPLSLVDSGKITPSTMYGQDFVLCFFLSILLSETLSFAPLGTLWQIQTEFRCAIMDCCEQNGKIQRKLIVMSNFDKTNLTKLSK